MADDQRPVGGGFPRAPKRTHGNNWLRKRTRRGKDWQERKMLSPRYCPPTKVRG